MVLSPDQIIYFKFSFVQINATIAFSIVLVFFLTTFSFFLTRKLSVDKPGYIQTFLESLIELIESQISELNKSSAEMVFPFIATLFLFIAISNIAGVIPGFHRPTASLSTTCALAICVFFAVPFFGIRKQGTLNYFKEYIKPNPFMLPFNILEQITRTFALAIRLFGNIMSGSLISGILLLIIPVLFPVLVELLELLTGVIQAYIFTMLALVFISSATTKQKEKNNGN